MSARKILAEIKSDLEPFVGNRIRLKANRGRKKIVERMGVLESTYPNIFVVRLDEKLVERRVSYSYADILTESVVVTVCHDEEDIKIQASKA